MKRDSPLISIILVNYNGYKDTIECVESLKRITYENYEIVIVDNGSTDSSIVELKKLCDKNIVVIDAKSNLGFSGGNNLGIHYALENGAKYVLLLNNDTFVQEDCLNKLVETALRYKNKVITTGKIYYAFEKNVIWYGGGVFNKKTGRVSHIGIHAVDDGRYDDEKKVTFISGCCMLIPSEAIDKVGMMEESYFLYCEDLDYGCRFMSNGYKLIYQPQAVIYHKINASTGKVSDTVTYYTVRNKLYYINKFIPYPSRIIAHIYNALEIFKRVITKEYTLDTVCDAYKDFKKGIIGKR